MTFPYVEVCLCMALGLLWSNLTKLRIKFLQFLKQLGTDVTSEFDCMSVNTCTSLTQAAKGCYHYALFWANIMLKQHKGGGLEGQGVDNQLSLVLEFWFKFLSHTSSQCSNV